jgi:acyl-CoA thioesterase-1
MFNHLSRTLSTCLFSFLITACSEASVYAPLAPDTVVLAFGDSVTYGTGAQRSQDYPTQLAARSGWQVVNAGIPGDTAGAAKLRIDAALKQTNPALVIIELGGNDFLRRRPEAEVKEDLRAIVRSVKDAGAMPVLVAVPSFSLVNWGLADAAIYSALAEEENVVLVERVFSSVLSDPALRADPIHPNAAGYQVLADGIAASLQQSGLLATQ